MARQHSPAACSCSQESDYKRLTTRRYFEAVTLKQLAAFTRHLQTNDTTLRVSAIGLVNRHPHTADFDVDLAVSYLVYDPRERETPAAP